MGESLCCVSGQEDGDHPDVEQLERRQHFQGAAGYPDQRQIHAVEVGGLRAFQGSRQYAVISDHEDTAVYCFTLAAAYEAEFIRSWNVGSPSARVAPNEVVALAGERFNAFDRGGTFAPANGISTVEERVLRIRDSGEPVAASEPSAFLSPDPESELSDCARLIVAPLLSERGCNHLPVI